MSISTKTGDGGETSLLTGERVKKTDLRVEVLGDLDELSAELGFVQNPEARVLQQDLFELSALFAGMQNKDMKQQRLRLEEKLEALEAALPPLRHFVFQGGHAEAAHLYMARAICRRAERKLCALPELPEEALPYMNRLSDYLFLLARKSNYDTKTPEHFWKP